MKRAPGAAAGSTRVSPRTTGKLRGIMVDATNQLLTRWREIAESRQSLDVGPEISRLALPITPKSRPASDRPSVIRFPIEILNVMVNSLRKRGGKASKNPNDDD